MGTEGTYRRSLFQVILKKTVLDNILLLYAGYTVDKDDDRIIRKDNTRILLGIRITRRIRRRIRIIL